MSDLYKLVFRGEVLEGQHPAVVRKRLAEAAAFDQAALDKLFSGQPVVLKRQADTATAARLQVMFKKAGARLRVLPVEGEEEMGGTSAPARAQPATDSPRSGAPSSGSHAALELLPAGSDILRTDERTPFRPREVETGGLALEGARFQVPEAPPQPAGPDLSHLTLAQTGADLGPRRPPPPDAVRAPELQIAEVGADLAPRAAAAPPAVDFASLAFDVAPPGSNLGQQASPPPPAAPDTSHLSLTSDDTNSPA